VINAYWHFIVMQEYLWQSVFSLLIVINAYWHFIVMQGQRLESLTSNPSFPILQAPPTIEQSISKNSSSH
jgi:hypothetical protein